MSESFDEFQRAPNEWDEFEPATPGPSTRDVLKAVSKIQPEQAARAAKLAKKYDAPNDVLLRTLQDVEMVDRVNAATAKLDKAPKLSEYMRSSPFVAAQAQKDIDPLVEIESGLGALSAAGVVQATLGISESIWRTPDAAQRMVGYVAGQIERTGLPWYLNPVRGVQDFIRILSEGQLPVGPKFMAGTTDVADKISDAQKLLSSDPDTFGSAFADMVTLGKNADKALEVALKDGNVAPLAEVFASPEYWAAGLSQAAPSLYAAIKSGGSTAFLAWMEGMEQASNAAEFEERTGIKVSDAEFAQSVMQTALINGWLEKSGLDKVMGAGGKGLRGIGMAALGEGTTETLQTINTNLSALLAYDDGKNILEGVVASFMGGVGSGGGVAAARASAEKAQEILTKRAQEIERTQNDAAKLQTLMAAAAKTTLRENNPETFAQLVQHLANNAEGAPTSLYIDGQVLNQAVQSLTPEQVAQAFPSLSQEQIAEAAASNTTVEIPVGELMAAVPGTPLEQVFLQNVRTTPDSLSLADVQQRGEQANQLIQAEAERVMQQAQDQAAWQASMESVKATILDQLNQVGRFAPSVNEAYATLQMNFFSTMAARLGMTPEALYQEWSLKVAGAQQASADPVLNSGIKPGIKPGELTVEGYHFSKAPRPTISTRFFGTGLRGSNRDLYANAADTRLRNRAYFYVDKGTGINPESGVGGIAQRANLSNIYDSDADPLKLKRGADQLAFESAVLDAGFSGYLVRLEGTQSGQAILLGDQSVQAEVLGPTTRIPAGQRVPALPRQAPQWQVQASGTPEQLQARLDRMQSSPAWADYEMRIEGNELQVRKKGGVFEQSVSTRLPTAKKALENPLEDMLIIGLEAAKADPKAFEKNIELIRQYPNFRDNKSASTPDKAAEQFIKHVVDNLLWLYDQVPAETRERSKLWYDGARAIVDRWAPKYGVTDAQVAGMLAVLSPQKDWFQNVSLAERVLDIMTTKQDFAWSDEMSQTAAGIGALNPEDVGEITGKTLGEIDSNYLQAVWVRVYDQTYNERGYRVVSPEGDFTDWVYNADGTTKSKAAWGSFTEIGKAISIFKDGSIANISASLGEQHKVRNFYNNIFNPASQHGDVAIDTHAVAAGLLRPLSGSATEVLHNFGAGGAASSSVFGSKGTYGIYAEAYRRAAEQRGVLPREMQSIAWEAVRGLYTAGFKAQASNVAKIDAVWAQYKKRRISLDEARKQLLDLSGGIAAPEWERPSAGAPEAAWASSYTGELRQDGGADRTAGRGDRGVLAQSEPGGLTDGRPEQTGDRGGRYSSGSLAPLEGAPVVAGATGPDPKLVAVAEQYARDNGIDLRRQDRFVEVDEARAARIAQAYAEMPHAPNDPKVKEAYDDLIRQTRAQYDALVAAGYQFTFFDDTTDPYGGNPWNAMRDLRANQRMAVYGTYAGFGVGAQVNIGLADPNGGENLDPAAVLQALRDVGAEVEVSNVFSSDTEPTLVAKIKQALTKEQGDKVSEMLGQEAIAQRTDDEKGQLFGPMAEKWGPYNPSYFVTVTGDRADAIANPMLQDTGLEWPDQNGEMRPVLANDLFRAVHDAFGHGLEGAGFRARGEENAWQAHVRLFTGPAVGAITSETRGQNSWLNYGPYGEKNRNAAVEDTVFAEQKTGLMPEWTWTEGRAADMPDQVLEQGPVATPTFEATYTDAQGERFNITLRREVLGMGADRQLSVIVEARTTDGSRRGMIDFAVQGNTLAAENTIVAPAYRRRGLAEAMYRTAREAGYDIMPGRKQTADGERMVASLREKGVINIERGLEQGPRPELPETIEVDGVQRPTRNSNGQPIHPTEEGIRNFWRWFGDSEAVVAVNAETGAPVVSSREPKRFVPRVMYHTTRNDFSVFEIGRTTRNSGTFGDWETQRHAIFVTPEVEASQAYGTQGGRFATGANVMPLYVKAERPLNLVNGVSAEDAAKLEEAGMSPRFIYNGLGYWAMFDDEDGAETVALIKKAGYDSVIFNDENPDTGEPFEAWALFAPEQIKSATGNQGTFDPANPNILKQGPRGTFNPQSLLITLNDNANLSTFLHESGHFFLEVLADLASRPDAPQQIRDDMDKVLAWFGIKGDEQVGGPDAGGELAQSMPDTIEVDGVQRPTTNSNGQRIATTEQGLVNFWRWFGDSKVVDAEGRPLVVYRGEGTGGDFEQFDRRMTGENAFFFTADKSIASVYARGQEPRQFYLKSEKLVDITRGKDSADFIRKWAKVWDEWVDRQSGEEVDPVEYVREGRLFDYEGDWSGERWKDLQATIESEGFDGAVLPDWDNDTGMFKAIVVFTPTQIKSATGNTGNFDPTNPSILAQNGNLPQDNTQPAGRTPLDVWRAMTLDQKRPYHEKWAESFEQYLLEGKAPSQELQSLFRTFRSWLINVYKSLKEIFTGAEQRLSPEIRQVFDRMLATDEQIAAAEEAAGMMPDFDATNEAIEKLQSRSLRDLKWTVNARSKAIKELQKQAATLRKSIEAEVRAEVEQQPVYRAMLWLKKGETTDPDTGEAVKAEKGFRLSTTALAEMYPDSMLSRPDLDKLRGMKAKDGLHPDLVADMFGFPSGDALVRAIIDAEPLASVVEGITDQRMLERHGDLVDQRAIEEAANEAVHNEARARALATELRSQAEMLNPRQDTGRTSSNGRPITVNAIAAAAKDFAANLAARRKVKDLKSAAWQHRAAEARAAKAWQDATAKGKTQEAVQAKRDQVLNNAAAKALLEAQTEVKKIRDFFARVTKGNDEKVVERGRDPDVVNAMRAVLAAYNVAPRLGKSALEYMETVSRNDPAMYAALKPGVDAALLAARPVEDLTMEELRGLHDELRAMWELAKRSRQMEVDGNLLDIEDAADKLLARMEEIGIPAEIPGERAAITDREEAGIKLQFAKAILSRVEQWAERMDGKFGGPFLRLVFQPIKEAADAYRTARVDYRKRFTALLENVSPVIRPGAIPAPELGYTFGNARDSGQAELLHAILHTGNESNKRKLLLGRGWASENPDGTIDTARWDAFIKRMVDEGKLEKAHYDFAQGVWDLLEEMKPRAQETHRKVFGRYFAEVTATPFDTPFGSYRGGYVPAQTDSRLVKDAKLRELAEAENESMAYAFPASPSGFTKTRVEYNKPLLLDLRALAQHMDKVLLFSHMQGAVTDVRRLLTNKRVSYALDRIDPGAYEGMLIPWLNRAAKQIVETPIVGDRKLSRFLSALRSRAGMALMFANLSNTVQQITGFSLAAVKVRPNLMMKATASFIADPKAMKEQVATASEYMRNRMLNEVAAMNDAVEQILVNATAMEKAQAWTQRHAYFLQVAVDNTMSPIIWTAAYNQAIEQQMSHKDAVRFADGVIRQTQGTTLPEDISRFESGPAYGRLFTQFIGYFNMMANTNATAVKQIVDEMGVRKGAGKLLYVALAGLLVPIWVAETIALGFRGGPEDEDDDGWLDDWLAAVFGLGTIRGLGAQVPLVGQAAQLVVNRFNDNPADDKFSLSPAVSLIESTVSAPSSVYKAIVDDGNKQKAVRDVAAAATMITGLPIYAAARPVGYLAGVADERIEPTGPVDLTRGLITGTASPESKQP